MRIVIKNYSISLEAETCAEEHQLDALEKQATSEGVLYGRWDNAEGRRGAYMPLENLHDKEPK